MSVVVVHHIGSPADVRSALWKFTKKGKEAAHYIIQRDGQMIKLIHESLQAPHAGISYWKGKGSVNKFSVGIELVHENKDQWRQTGNYMGIYDRVSNPFRPEQYRALIDLLKKLCRAYGIPRHRIIGHGDVALCGPKNSRCKTRKVRLGARAVDPGLDFDWVILEKQGLLDRETI